jgi:hypothetical protein
MSDTTIPAGELGAADTSVPTTDDAAPAAQDAAPAAPAPAEAASEKQEKPAERLTPKFVELARREKKLVERERSLKDQETQYQAWQSARAKVRDNPAAALEALGVTLDDIVQAYIPPKQETAEERVARLELEIRQKEQAAQAAAEQAAQAAAQREIDSFKSHMKSAIDKDERFELVTAQEAHDLVFELIEQHHEQTGEVLRWDVAAQKVEDYLFERGREVLARSKKFRAVFEGSKEEPALTPAPKAEAGKPSPTLTQRVASPPAPAAPEHFESHEEAVARIAAKRRSAKAQKTA